MRFTRWLNPMHPQTLQYAVMLFYIKAVFGVIFLQVLSPIGLVLVLAEVFSGLGVANSYKVGYKVAVVVAALAAAFAVYVVLVAPSFATVLDAIFPVALFALLVHPMSRNYQRIWFE